ncbi:MAG TPA: UDP-N-acetylenolpyruvoylglucosamine reductase [Verrucomicrobia bacterium]|nr:MAG: UDP-N-acetylenolpyruvoylglucosamine reductase [Lentisphaerae bacterium GWF2_57_35]HBA86261.1 UDP-N-acetylenolpyruvoylglucosamine reductase [Verrucomicrobiota bacterium]
MNWNELALDGVKIHPHARLSDYTTLRLGGICPCLLDCGNAKSLLETVRQLAHRKMDFILIGGGSNLLVADAGLEQVVVRYYNETPAIRREGNLVEVEGATLLDELAKYTVEQGLEGLVYGSGIPGTAAGAVAGNAGAFGRQIGDRVESVLLADRKGVTRWEKASLLDFGYRKSRLQTSDEILVSVRLQLEEGDRKSLTTERGEVIALRRSKHPDWHTTPTAGSFFKNIEPTSSAERRQAAGWFLEKAGAKEMHVGGARLFEKHANIIVTEGHCRAADVWALSQKMAEAVKVKFGLNLEPEVRKLGKFNP